MFKNIDKFAGKLDVATINGKLTEERGVLIISRIKEANTDSKILVIANNDAIDYIRQNTVNYMT
jgi:ActR/RegA family two-component response regulator